MYYLYGKKVMENNFNKNGLYTHFLVIFLKKKTLNAFSCVKIVFN